MEKFLNAEMLEIKADLKPEDKEEILEFCDTIFDAFDKLGATSALYVDMFNLVTLVCEIQPICDCESPYYNHEHECHIAPNLCVYHNSRLANRERAYQDWVKYLDTQGIKLDNEEEE